MTAVDYKSLAPSTRSVHEPRRAHSGAPEESGWELHPLTTTDYVSTTQAPRDSGSLNGL